MTYPAPIVLTHVEVVVVAQLQTCVAELAITAILRLLGQLEVTLEIDDGRLELVELEYPWSQSLLETK